MFNCFKVMYFDKCVAIFPTQMRADVYVNLICNEFARFDKKNLSIVGAFIADVGF